MDTRSSADIALIARFMGPTWGPSGARSSADITLIARFMGPTWGQSGFDRTHAGPMLAPWTLLSGNVDILIDNYILHVCLEYFFLFQWADYIIKMATTIMSYKMSLYGVYLHPTWLFYTVCYARLLCKLFSREWLIWYSDEFILT